MMRLIIVVAAFAAVAGLWVVDRDGAPSWLAPYAPEWLGPDADSPDADGVEQDEDVVESPAPQASPVEPVVDAPPSDGIPENANLRMNEAGLQIIKDAEGLSLTAYSASGKSFIGYGHQRQPGDPSEVTEAEATALLREDVKVAESVVRRFLTRPANENEFSAMVSLAYNLGRGSFHRSDVPKKFNAGDRQGAADAFRNHNTGGGVVLQHLIERREKERALFLTPA